MSDVSVVEVHDREAYRVRWRREQLVLRRRENRFAGVDPHRDRESLARGTDLLQVDGDSVVEDSIDAEVESTVDRAFDPVRVVAVVEAEELPRGAADVLSGETRGLVEGPVVCRIILCVSRWAQQQACNDKKQCADSSSHF